MKKTVHFIMAMAFLLTAVNGKAQLANGSIAADFTFIDIDSTTHHLYDILDSGKTVYIDVSAAWCSPCWSYHNSGNLETLYDTYGPAGTDELRVFFIEGELQNTTAQLHGIDGGTSSTSTQGDWVTGTSYPIIDLSSSVVGADDFLTNYNIGYFPTVYMICPDRSITEVGAVSTADLYAAKSVCAVATNASDAEMITALEFNMGLVTCDSVTPTFRFANIGTDTLTSATITMAVDGTVQKTINWTGSLGTYESTTITGQKIGASSPGEHIITATISNPNGVIDSTTYNDSTTASFVVYASVGGSYITETFETSGIPSDWIILPGGSDTWTETMSAGYNSSVSVKLPFYYIGAGQIDYMKLPPMSFAGATTASLTFDVAYAQYNSSTNDRLQVEVSIDCGVTWSTKYNKAGVALKTVPAATSSFTPGSDSDWRHEVVSLTSIAGESQVLVRFKGTSDYGNNLFIDNINFYNTDVTGVEESKLVSNISLYPNPATTNATIEFNLRETTPVSISMINALGQTVLNENLGKINGFQKHIINTTSLENGLYFLSIKTGNETVTRKITVNK